MVNSTSSEKAFKLQSNELEKKIRNFSLPFSIFRFNTWFTRSESKILLREIDTYFSTFIQMWQKSPGESQIFLTKCAISVATELKKGNKKKLILMREISEKKEEVKKIIDTLTPFFHFLDTNQEKVFQKVSDIELFPTPTYVDLEDDFVFSIKNLQFSQKQEEYRKYEVLNPLGIYYIAKIGKINPIATNFFGSLDPLFDFSNLQKKKQAKNIVDRQQAQAREQFCKFLYFFRLVGILGVKSVYTLTSPTGAWAIYKKNAPLDLLKVTPTICKQINQYIEIERAFGIKILGNTDDFRLETLFLLDENENIYLSQLNGIHFIDESVHTRHQRFKEQIFGKIKGEYLELIFSNSFLGSPLKSMNSLNLTDKIIDLTNFSFSAICYISFCSKLFFKDLKKTISDILDCIIEPRPATDSQNLIYLRAFIKTLKKHTNNPSFEAEIQTNFVKEIHKTLQFEYELMEILKDKIIRSVFANILDIALKTFPKTPQEYYNIACNYLKELSSSFDEGKQITFWRFLGDEFLEKLRLDLIDVANYEYENINFEKTKISILRELFLKETKHKDKITHALYFHLHQAAILHSYNFSEEFYTYVQKNLNST
ncbi:MAG: hypothetical protein BGO10_08865 [Chlamydia sp. 32-24]|nr:MAG: hypothetical protein BGO10_08865 [Chlamydia sp. 32-24]